MSETAATTANPLLAIRCCRLADAASDAAFCRDRAGAFPARLRAGLRRPHRRGRRRSPTIPALPDFDNTVTALERSGKLLTQGLGGVLRPGVGALQPGDPGDRQGGVAADGAALEPDHDERRAVRPHRHAAREACDLGSDRRADAAAGAHLYPLPPLRRRPHRGGQEADGRDQRAARPSRHQLQPPSARRRAGLVHGTRRGRPRRPARQLCRRRQGCGRRARHGRQGDRDPVALLRRAVPEELGAGATCARRSTRPSSPAATMATPTTTTRPSSRS